MTTLSIDLAAKDFALQSIAIYKSIVQLQSTIEEELDIQTAEMQV